MPSHECERASGSWGQTVGDEERGWSGSGSLVEALKPSQRPLLRGRRESMKSSSNARDVHDASCGGPDAGRKSTGPRGCVARGESRGDRMHGQRASSEPTPVVWCRCSPSALRVPATSPRGAESNRLTLVRTRMTAGLQPELEDCEPVHDSSSTEPGS